MKSMKTMKNKITMLFVAMLFVFALTPAIKAEAYGVDQTAATATEATIVWTPDMNSSCVGYYVYVNNTAISDLLPVGTSTYNITNLSQGTPYFVEIAEVYVYSDGEVKAYSGGSAIVRTKPNKVSNVEATWSQSDRITIYADDSDAYYTSDGSVNLYADGFEIKVKDKNGKVRKTIKDGYNWSIYAGAKESFDAHSKLKNKGMIYTVRPYIELDNGQRVYGETVTKVAVPQAKISKIRKVSSSKYKVTWKKVSGATGYTIYRVNADSKGNWKSVKKVKKVSKNTTSYTLKKSYIVSDKNTKGIIVVANGVKIKGKKYSSTKSYYTYSY